MLAACLVIAYTRSDGFLFEIVPQRSVAGLEVLENVSVKVQVQNVPEL